MLQHHNDDTKDEETILHVDPQDTENTKERNMILNTYDDTAGYVDSKTIYMSLILIYSPYHICNVLDYALMFF